MAERGFELLSVRPRASSQALYFTYVAVEIATGDIPFVWFSEPFIQFLPIFPPINDYFVLSLKKESNQPDYWVDFPWHSLILSHFLCIPVTYVCM